MSYNVSVNLKRIRQAKGMSLDRVAEQTGVSKSMLAQIEKGTANPSLGVLAKITSGLRIDFQTLTSTPRQDYCLVDPEKLVPIKEVTGLYKVWNCFPFEDSQAMEVYRIDVEPGGSYVSGSHGENTREYICVTEGILTVECHDHVQEITKEQIYKLETDQTHIYRNNGEKTARCICYFLDYTHLRG